jgi:ABC-type molybdate transport system substrate-binding protein
MVYRSDVGGRNHADGGVEVLLEIDREPDPPIRYVAALSRRSPRLTPGSSELLDFLASAEARAIFVRHGFLPLS